MGGPGAGGAISEEMVKTLMDFDKDGDGKLTKAEVPERMQGLFERGDLNQDGSLTKEELTKMAQAQAPSSTGGPGGRGGRGGFGQQGGFPRGDQLLAALDANSDGVLSTE
jgi:Ca2+-binding EF-hand superfamily protein